VSFGNPRQQPRSKIAAEHSARSVGYERCPYCQRWAQCRCAQDAVERGRREEQEAERDRKRQARRAEQDRQDRQADEYLRRHGRG